MKSSIILLSIMTSVIAYSQNVKSQLDIKTSQIDSLIKLPNTTAVEVSSSLYKEQFSKYQTRVFKIENNFLVIDGSLYFDLDKLIIFRRTGKLFIKGSVIEFYFE